jgi:hypothetical protein
MFTGSEAVDKGFSFVCKIAEEAACQQRINSIGDPIIRDPAVTSQADQPPSILGSLP